MPTGPRQPKEPRNKEPWGWNVVPKMASDSIGKRGMEYLPTPEQIQEMTAAIREEWDELEELHRRVGTNKRIPVMRDWWWKAENVYDHHESRSFQ